MKSAMKKKGMKKAMKKSMKKKAMRKKAMKVSWLVVGRRMPTSWNLDVCGVREKVE